MKPNLSDLLDERCGYTIQPEKMQSKKETGMNLAAHLLGIDVGSVAVHVATIDARGEIIKTAGMFHHGDLVGALRKVIGRFDLAGIDAVAATTATPPHVAADGRYDDRLCVMEAVRRRHGQAGAILSVGGERFSLISFDEAGNYRACKTNTSCAAGTGSFLDQQARRLNLPDVAEKAYFHDPMGLKLSDYLINTSDLVLRKRWEVSSDENLEIFTTKKEKSHLLPMNCLEQPAIPHIQGQTLCNAYSYLLILHYLLRFALRIILEGFRKPIS